MEQRPLRLGEIVDDYCPRERRITNHAIVALVGDTIKQTRCSTCDTEHVFKGGRAPGRKKKNDIAALETAVLASVNGTQLVARIDPAQPPPARSAGTKPAEPEMPMAAAVDVPAPATATPSEAPPTSEPATDAQPGETGLAGGWIGHRTLIRAALPRTEGEPPPARPIPEFTMHQRQTRGSHQFRHGNGWGGGDRQSRGGYRGNGHGNGNGNGEVNGNRANSNGNSFNHHNHGNGFGGNGNHGQGGRPQGQGGGGGGRRHRHGKHRRPR